jgi:FkbM family methyltransferase
MLPDFMYKLIEKPIKKIFGVFGFYISRINNTPVGDMESFLEDVKRRGLNINFILDVGAYKGLFSELALSVFPDAFIYMIEPLDGVEADLLKFCKKHPNTKHLKLAVGSADSVQHLQIAEKLACSSFYQVQNRNPDSQKVYLKTIDTLIEEGQIMIPEIVKIDVQGYELEVLKGASKLFDVTELFIIEVSLQKKEERVPLMGDIISFMAERSYVIYDFSGFLRHKEDGSLFECDVCFVRKDSSLRKPSSLTYG